jgi:phytanoyl-CoA hydroxylase
MWGVPGSHKTPTSRFFKAYTNENGKRSTYFEPAKQLEYDLTGSVPLDAEKGTVVLLHGDFVHYSFANTSNQQRHAYTIHLIETKDHVYEDDNWLQRFDIPFRQLY